MAKLQQKLELTQKLTPQQVLQANILQLNTNLLEQRIFRELEENPALEMAEIEEKSETEVDKEHSEDLLEEKINEDDSVKELDEKTSETDFEWEELMGDPDEYDYQRYTSPKQEEYREIPIKANKTLNDKLIEQLQDLNLSSTQMNIAQEIIGNISNSGYLTIDTVLISDRMGIPEIEVLDVLQLIHKLDPPGIGARNLRECLLAQLDGMAGHLIYRIIDEHFDDFANRRYAKITEKLNCSNDELQEIMEDIARLNPNPGEGSGNEEKDFIIPDLTSYQDKGEWIVIVNDSSLPELRINQDYSKILEEYRDKSDVKQFVKGKLDSAKWFIEAINQRRQTMRMVMAGILHKQPGFFNSDKRELTPMILKDIAEELHLDISTISRVTNGKYVQLPFGIYELKDFFSEGIQKYDGTIVSNTVVKKRLKEIIGNEDKKTPLGDEDLAKILNKEGFKVARRTVAKYREQMKISVSRLRKSIQ